MPAARRTLAAGTGRQRSDRAAWPGRQRSERAACGMGFVATTGAQPTHAVVAAGVTALARLAHRGGLDADGRSGDGAGLMIQVPRRLLGNQTAVAVLFDWDSRSRETLAAALASVGMGVADWRLVPVDAGALGEKARSTMPRIWHAIVTRPDVDDLAWEDLLHRARRRAEQAAEAAGMSFEDLVARILDMALSASIA